jgi:membrane protein DedA with SNARE-associated domain
LESSVLHWVATYGYVAIFSLLVLGIVGVPVPDEFLLGSCGFLVYQGHLRLAPTLAAGILGSMTGITCSYLIGRTVGWKFLHSRFGRLLHISDANIRRVHDWFDRVGHWALLIGYFIPGVRHFTAIVAGTSRLEPKSFAMYAYSGAVLWVSTFVTIGYHFGPEWQRILGMVERNLKTASMVAGVAILAYAAFVLIRRRSAKRSRPRTNADERR